MTKYWNSRRLERVRKRKIQVQARRIEKAKELRESDRTYSRGDTEKNANLMLNALGLALRRCMVLRLKQGGAMSLSKLVEPFGITLPTAFVHLQALERAGAIISHKKGRIRMCVYNRDAFRELANWLIQ